MNIVNKIVNFVNSIFLAMANAEMYFKLKTKYLLGLSVMLFTVLICAAFSFTKNDDFELAKQEILLRKIGHQILLTSGDSTSRVLPIERITENEYQIRFENEFTFQPDSLVKTIGKALEKNVLSQNYIVNVLSCSANQVVFGYAISENKKDDIIACSGRKQPKNCYLINLKFENRGIAMSKGAYLIGGIPLLAFIGFIISRGSKTKKREIETDTTTNVCFKIGNTLFDSKKRQLVNTGTIELTLKENKLLLIFAHSPNEIIERTRLQKEIWEDEGVIVGRSLDMFISKLRKKLESDRSIQLINIHGKGYKLDINI